MVESPSTGDRGGALEPVELPDKERRGLARCRRALEKGRRVRGRVAASGDLGVLVELRGAVGHVPASDRAAGGARRSLWPGAADRWEGWVSAVAGDVVHLCARRPAGRPDEETVRRAQVVSVGRSGALARLADDGATAVVPWEELSWQPSLEPPALERGMEVAGRVVGLTLEGPVLSPRSVVPSPWPAIALAHPPGTEVEAVVERIQGDQALLRTERAPRARTIVGVEALPGDAAPGSTLGAAVVRVNALAGELVLAGFSSRPGRPRAPRPAPGAERPGRQGPEQAASGSRS
jgi:hypothetical protein